MSRTKMPVVLILCDYYLPGHLAGGTLRALANMAERMGDDFQFMLMTRDHDLGILDQYECVIHGRWQRVGKVLVRYLPKAHLTPVRLASLIRETPHDILYLNSFFSAPFTILPLLLRRLGRIPKRPLVLAPRGEMAPSALALKSPKKKAYLFFGKTLGLWRDALMQASGEHERRHIINRLGRELKVLVAPDIPELPGPVSGLSVRPAKKTDSLSAVFLGRLARNKNLSGALEILSMVEPPCSLDIYGPIVDQGYWQECLSMIKGMPKRHKVNYRGVTPHQEVSATLAAYDVLLLPSWGENFGHAILESLAAACPVVISDQTPWRGLQGAGVGWDLPLADIRQHAKALEEIAAMDQTQHDAYRRRAQAFARKYMLAAQTMELSKKLFHQALDLSRRQPAPI